MQPQEVARNPYLESGFRPSHVAPVRALGDRDGPLELTRLLCVCLSERQELGEGRLESADVGRRVEACRRVVQESALRSSLAFVAS